MHQNMIILYFSLPYFHVSNNALFFLHNTSVLSLNIDVVLTLSIEKSRRQSLIYLLTHSGPQTGFQIFKSTCIVLANGARITPWTLFPCRPEKLMELMLVWKRHFTTVTSPVVLIARQPWIPEVTSPRTHMLYIHTTCLWWAFFLVISLPTTNGIAVTSIFTTRQKMLLLVLKQFMISQILHYMHNGWNIWLFVCCRDTCVHICIWIYTYVCVRIKIKMFLMYLLVYLHPCEKVIRFLFRIKFDRHSKVSL